MHTPPRSRRAAAADAPPSATTLALNALLAKRESRLKSAAAAAAPLRDPSGQQSPGFCDKENMGTDDDNSDNLLNDFESSPEVAPKKAGTDAQHRRLQRLQSSMPVHAPPASIPCMDDLTNDLSQLGMQAHPTHVHGSAADKAQHSRRHHQSSRGPSTATPGRAQLLAANRVPLPSSDDETDTEGKSAAAAAATAAAGQAGAHPRMHSTSGACSNVSDADRISISDDESSNDSDSSSGGSSCGGSGVQHSTANFTAAHTSSQQPSAPAGSLILGDANQFKLDARVATKLYPHQVRPRCPHKCSASLQHQRAPLKGPVHMLGAAQKLSHEVRERHERRSSAPSARPLQSLVCGATSARTGDRGTEARSRLGE